MSHQTRNQVAQLALNTLKTPVVVPETNTPDITIGSGETSVTINGNVNYKVTASRDAYARAISSVEGSDQSTVNGIQGWVIELGEKLYSGKLQLDEDGVYDVFGRPARKWQYDGTTFGTYAKTELLRQEYTTKVTGKDLYDLLGADLIRQYDVNVAVDGERTYAVLGSAYFTEASLIRTNTEKVGETGNGVLTQVYVDSINHVVDIAIINTYLAKANQDYNTKDNDVDLKVYKIDGKGAGNAQYVKTAGEEELLTVNGEDLSIEDVKEGDFFLVTVADGEIQSMVAPEIVSETTLNSFKESDWVKNDDVQYDYASTAQYDDEVLDEYDRSNMQSVTYDIILDRYGYLIGIELNEELSQYLFLTGMDLGSSNLSVKNAEANVIFLDGTMSTVTVKVDKSQKAETKSVTRTDANGVETVETYTITGGTDDISNIVALADMSQINTWCTYTVDADGVYTLKVVGNRSNARADGFKGARKIAQSVMNVANGQMGIVPATAGELEISGKSVALDGSRYLNNGNPNMTGDFTYVYGNEETVYINASLKVVGTRNGGDRAIVDKVDSATTGVKNVDMTVKNLVSSDFSGATVPTNEVYVLYKDNGYVIGAVTLGAEDNGTTNNWAYITGKVNREDLVGTNQWRWSKEAIINGKIVTLYEVGDSMDILDDNKTVQGNWYSLRFDKDGNVASIKQETAPSNDINFNAAPQDEFVTSVNDVYNASNGAGGFSKSSNVLLHADYRCNDTSVGHSTGDRRELKFENGTLYTNRSASEGFQIMPDANIVVITSKTHGSGLYNTVTDGYVGWTGMQEALKALDSETTGGYSAFDGILTAVFKDGRATSVILHDQSGRGNGGVTETGKPMEITVNKVDTNGNSVGASEVISWYGSAFTGTEAIVPSGYAFSGTRGTLPTYAEGGTGTVTFVYRAVRSDYNGTITPGMDYSTNGVTAAWTCNSIAYEGATPTLDQILGAIIDQVEQDKNVTFSEQDISGTKVVLKFKGSSGTTYQVEYDTSSVTPGSQGTLGDGTNIDDVLDQNPDVIVLEDGANITLSGTQASKLDDGQEVQLPSTATLTIEGGTVGADIAGNGTVALTGGEISGDITGAAKVNLTGGKISGDITGAAVVTLTDGEIEGDITGAAVVTLTDGEIKGDITGAAVVTLDAGEISGNVGASAKINVTGTDGSITGAVDASTEVNVADDAQVTLAASVGQLPKLTGNGVVVITGDILTPANDQGEKDYLGNLIAQLGLEINSLVAVTGEDGSYAVATAAGPQFAQGSGKIESYSSVLSLTEIAGYAGGGTNVTFQRVSLAKSALSAGCKVQAYFSTNNGSSWTLYPNSAIFGSGDGGSVFDADRINSIDEDTLNVIIPATDNVTNIKFVVTPAAQGNDEAQD